MKAKVFHVSFMVGDKKFNEIWAGFDLGSTGVFYEEAFTMTAKEPADMTDKKKKELIDGITKIYEEGGKEVRDFKITAEI